MTLVFDRKDEGSPGTHAIVIGVGAYPWLQGGENERGYEVSQGMGQLDSSPISARALADWLIADYRHPGCELATVDLMLSEDVGDLPTYVPSRTADGTAPQPMQVEHATLEAIRLATVAWKKRGNGNPGNLLIFFFCGHGVEAGYKFALLARDFGEDEERPFRGAFSIPGLVEGMRTCAAERQIYFVDACRSKSKLLLESYTEQLDPLVGMRPPVKPVTPAMFYATLAGEPAFGRDGHVSLFTQALLEGLRGLAANDDTGTWWVETTSLQRALTVRSRELADVGMTEVQTPAGGNQTSFNLNCLPMAPRVPLCLKLDWADGDAPPDDLLWVSVSCEQNVLFTWTLPWAEEPACTWLPLGRFRCDLEAGLRYAWSAELKTGQRYCSSLKPLNPPFRIVEFPKDG